MRFSFRLAVLWVVLLLAGVSRAAVPTGISLSVHGDFDPGTSGATANNSDTISTLTLRTASVTFESADVSAVLLPGNILQITLGSVSAFSTGLDSLPFDGSTLNLSVELLDPPAVPSVATIPLAITGNVGPFGDTISLTAPSTQDQVEFMGTDCLPKIISVSNTAPTAVDSGSGPIDIAGSLSLVNGLSFVPGDVDGDGSVTLLDAVRGLMLVSGIDEAQCEEIERGDLSGSGAMDLVNVVLIARKSYGL